MERLTEWDEYGDAGIIALSDVMPEIYAELSFSETNDLTDVLNRLAAYEDTGLTPEEIKEVQEALEPIPFGRFRDIMEAERAGRLVLPSESNTPLTLDELREMDGEPVWIQAAGKPGIGRYEVLGEYSSELNAQLMAGGKMMDCDTYGKTWLAYRRKPEEGTT